MTMSSSPCAARRAAACDGWLGVNYDLDTVFSILTRLAESRRGLGREKEPFDIVVEGETPGDDREEAAAIVREREKAGATWWIEAMWSAPELEDALTRVKQGPPHIE